MSSKATKKGIKSCIFTRWRTKPRHYSSFSAWCTDLKNILFEKIHLAPSKVIEVNRLFSKSRRPNFVFLLVFTMFLPFSVLMNYDLGNLGNLVKGIIEFFQKLHFWNQCIPMKKWALSSKFSLNLSIEKVCKTRLNDRFSSHSAILA